ncbi:MAG: uroporphyrinogen-III C-methyltransferase [bacterium]|nr:uroporphyrinogen-III C-methyltransferase [bacterium]
MTHPDSKAGSTRIPLVTSPAMLTVRARPYLAYLLAFLALCLAAYVWKVTSNDALVLRSQQEKLLQIDTRFVELQRQQQRLVDDLALKSRQLDDVSAKLARWDDTLNATQRRVWLVNESDHYLRLAQQHLQLTRDVAGARALLDVADRLLAAHGDNQVLPLRTAIAKDRLALSAAMGMDVPGLYLRLGALSEHVGVLQLPQLTGKPLLQPDEVVPAVQPTAPGLMDVGWAKMRALVTVRHYDEPLRPLLSEADRALVREALRLDLAQAQLALMRGEPVVYKASLLTAKNRLARYFPLLPKTEYDNLLKELLALAAVDIRPALPDLGTSIRALDALSASPARTPVALPARENP